MFGQEKLETPPYPSYVELRNDGRYEFICSQGHKTITILQQQKFEVLYEIGAYALIDGYYRESIASFTSALERFYEFFLLVKSLQNKVDTHIFNSAWKLISSQSERQLGAFIFSYTEHFSKQPTLLSQNNIAFRNSVIHKGTIPTKNEALDYGQEILNVVTPLLRETLAAFPDGVQQSIFKHLQECRGEEEGLPISTMSMPTILSIDQTGSALEIKNLETELDNLKWWRQRW
ncbi:hypothetical protein [Pseudomonas sp. CBC3]|uniref:hypothetical protein n=1 Tax=Pseudomonas sp. CBC3 TaxID=3123318 RepID=UPI0030E74E1F